MKQVKIENLLNKEMLRFVKEHKSNNANSFEHIQLATMYLSAGYAAASGIASVAEKLSEKVAAKAATKKSEDSEESSKPSKGEEFSDAMSATKDVLRKDVVLYATIAGVAGIAGCLYRGLQKK